MVFEEAGLAWNPNQQVIVVGVNNLVKEGYTYLNMEKF